MANMARRTARRPAKPDPRFDMSAWEEDARGSTHQAPEGVPEDDAPAYDAPADDVELDEPERLDAEDEETMDDGEETGAASAADEEHAVEKPLGPVLSKEKLEKYQQKQRKRGIIYISRIPPGMTPAKVRHIFSQFGEVDRMYLQPKHPPKGGKRKRMPSHFSEGWIEFTSKRVARTTAEMLNAQPIGALGGAAHSSRKSTGARVGNRWKDDVWTMKYLKGFRWPMLMEQMSHERASHAARMRLELSQSAYEQRDYLQKVERARAQRSRAAKHAEGAEDAPPPKLPAPHTFQQRTPVYRDVRDQRKHSKPESTRPSAAPRGAPGSAPPMDQVLDQIF